MAGITFAISEEAKSKMRRLSWVNWSELIRREVLKNELLKKFNSKEEQELIKWSVELGRKAKKESFKKMLLELPLKKREELLRKISHKRRLESLE